MDSIDLKLENGRKLYVNYDYLMPYVEGLSSFADGEDFMKNRDFAKRIMMSREIKSNNDIEGINDDLEFVNKVITTNSLFNDDVKRIANLYNGYKYILEGHSIDKKSLKSLYDILSDGLLSYRDRMNMGDYYRNDAVYISNGRYSEEKVSYLLVDSKISDLLCYINRYEDDSDISKFLKSQIIHFYFVYVHPYFDVNGRTSRTLSMWYLLNNSAYPYIVFNQGIVYSKKDYDLSIDKCIKKGEVTLFLKYMISVVNMELEKEYIIDDIISNYGGDVSGEELQIINYFLSLKGNNTCKDLVFFYKRFNNVKNVRMIFERYIKVLIDKEIFTAGSDTLGYVTYDRHNFNIGLNGNLIKKDMGKVKKLQLDKKIY